MSSTLCPPTATGKSVEILQQKRQTIPQHAPKPWISSCNFMIQACSPRDPQRLTRQDPSPRWEGARPGCWTAPRRGLPARVTSDLCTRESSASLELKWGKGRGSVSSTWGRKRRGTLPPSHVRPIRGWTDRMKIFCDIKSFKMRFKDIMYIVNLKMHLDLFFYLE